ncbi:MAG: hypothetical protein WAT43_03370 [Chitinophagales bacterium]
MKYLFYIIIFSTIPCFSQVDDSSLQNSDAETNYEQAVANYPDTIFFINLLLLSDSKEMNFPAETIVVDSVASENLLIYKTESSLFIVKQNSGYYFTYFLCDLNESEVPEVHVDQVENVRGNKMLNISITSGFWHMSACGGGGYSSTDAYLINLNPMQLICVLKLEDSETSCTNAACFREEGDTTAIENDYQCDTEFYERNEIVINKKQLKIIPLAISNESDFDEEADLHSIKTTITYSIRKYYLVKSK